MIWTSEQLAENHGYRSASIQDLVETMNATSDIWTLVLIAEGFDSHYWESRRGGRAPDYECKELKNEARLKVSRECWQQFPAMWSYDKLQRTFTSVPRDISGAEALLNKMSRRMRQIEWMSIWLCTWGPVELAHTATIDTPMTNYRAKRWAERKLAILRAACPWVYGEFVGPAAKLRH